MQNLPQDDQTNTFPQSSPGGLGSGVTTPTPGVSKEAEPGTGGGEAPQLEEIVAEVELEPDVERSGVEKKSEVVTLPPDLKKMGVSAVGPQQPVAFSTTVKLPLSDDQIAVGLHAKIIFSFRWLAEWCFRQLKKAHFHLRVIAGHAIREPDGKR